MPGAETKPFTNPRMNHSPTDAIGHSIISGAHAAVRPQFDCIDPRRVSHKPCPPAHKFWWSTDISIETRATQTSSDEEHQ